MRKLLVLAMTATLLMAGSAFAVDRHLVAKPDLTFAAGQPATTNNNDSCDIGVTPAATLLLPYFEVDTAATAGTGATTLFTITNTSPYPQIAHVTVWTDWSYPVLDFNIFLTGYDVQGINLFDVIVRGIVAPPSGTDINTTPGVATPAATLLNSTPYDNTSNPNFGGNFATNCAGLPGALPTDLVTAVRRVLTTGTGYNAPSGVPGCTSTLGRNHGTLAIGYVTVDVANNCTQQLPTDSGYYVGAQAAILFDNTLIGDYQQLGPSPAAGGATGSYDAGGNPMVHIRAIPEGGPAQTLAAVPTNLPWTFYDRYTPSTARQADRRQPLPSTFAARYIQGGTAGFATDYKIWREGLVRGLPGCTGTSGTATWSQNDAIPIAQIVRFDEHENSFGVGQNTNCSPCFGQGVTLPETSRTSTTAGTYPTLAGTDLGGWMYLNLDDQVGGTIAPTNALYSLNPNVRLGQFTGASRASQNWVIISMFGAVGPNRLSVDFDAAWLGNGCTPATTSAIQIAPANQRNTIGALEVCPVGQTCTPMLEVPGYQFAPQNP